VQATAPLARGAVSLSLMTLRSHGTLMSAGLSCLSRMLPVYLAADWRPAVIVAASWPPRRVQPAFFPFNGTPCESPERV